MPSVFPVSVRACHALVLSQPVLDTYMPYSTTNVKLHRARACRAISDAGIAALAAGRPQLRSLAVDECGKVTDASMRAVAGACRGLAALSVRRCAKLADEALAQVSGWLVLVCGVIRYPDVLGMKNARVLCQAGGTTCWLRWVAGWGSQLLILRLVVITHECIFLALRSCALPACQWKFQSRKCKRSSQCTPLLQRLQVAARGCLRSLCASGVPNVGDATMAALARHCGSTLETLDVSFCRLVSDDALGHVVDACQALKTLVLYGCSQVTPRFVHGHSSAALKRVEGLGPGQGMPVQPL